MGKENDVDIVGRMNQLVWLVLGGLAGLSHPLDLGKRFVQDLTTAKGQLISKCPFGVFKSTKKPTKFLQGFLP